MYSGCELKTGVASGNFNNKWKWNFQYSWVWDTEKIAGYGNFNQRWLLSNWVCVCVARLCCQVMSQRKRSLSNLPLSSYVSLFLFWHKCYFSYSRALHVQIEQRSGFKVTQSASLPMFFGVSQQFVSVSIFNCVVILCIFILLFSSLKRGIESQRLDVTLFEKKSCILDWLDNLYFSLTNLPVLIIESDSILVD